VSDPRNYRSPIEARVQACLHDFRGLLRTSLVLRGVSLLLVILAGLVYLSFGLDRLFRLSHVGRGVTLLLFLGTLGWSAWSYVVRPLLVRLPGAALADLLENRFPHLGDRLRSAVDFLRDAEVGDCWNASQETDDLTLNMKRRVAGQAARELETIEPSMVIDTPRVVSALTGGVAAVGAIGILWLMLGGAFGIWFERQFLFGEADYEYRTHLTVRGFDAERSRGVPRGDPIEIEVEASKEIPRRVGIRLEYPTGSARYVMEIRPGAETEAEEGVVFVHKHGSVTEDFEFTVEGGDFTTRPFRVRVLERPRVESLRITSTPPAYTGRGATVTDGDVGELAVVEGSMLELAGVSNKRLARASLQTEGAVLELAVDASDRTRFSGSWTPRSGGVSTVILEDAENVPPDRLLQFSVHLVADRQPVVQARTDGLGPMITADALMPFVISARDDYRIDKILLGWTVRDAKSGESGDGVELPIESLPSTEPLDSVSHPWEVKVLGIEPEKRLDVRIGAVDNDGLNGAKTGFSPLLSFLIVTPERLGDEFVRREVEQRRVLERLIAEERGVRDEIYRLIDESWQKDGPIADADVKLMLRLARVERQHGRALGSIADAIEQILAEMRNNRVGEADDLARLASLIIDPLRSLSGKTLPEIASRLAKIRQEESSEKRVTRGVDLGALVDEKLLLLDDALNQMHRLEGFTEIVKRMRSIIRTQSESSAAVRDAYRSIIDEIFDEDTGDAPGGGR